MVRSARQGRLIRAIIRHGFDRIRAEIKANSGEYPSIRKSVDEWLVYCKTIGGNSIGTLNQKKAVMRMWEEKFGPLISIGELSREELGRAIKARIREVDRSTCVRDVKILRNYGRWMSSNNYIGAGSAVVVHADVPKVKNQYKGRKVFKAPSRSGFMEVVEKIRPGNPHVAAVLMAMVLFGKRPEQLFRITMGMVEMPDGRNAGRIRIPGIKGGIDVEVAIEAGSIKEELLKGCIERLREWHGRVWESSPVFCKRRSRGRWSSSSFSHCVRDACRRAGIEGFTAYQARHAVITWLAQEGVSVSVIKEFAGHKSEQTQEIYKHTSGAEAVPGHAAVEEIVKKAAGFYGKKRGRIG